MRETKTKEKDVMKMQSEDRDNVSSENVVSQARSYESLWGALLFAFMLIFVIASIAAIGWGGYSKWKVNRAEKAEPSIAVLQMQLNEQKDTASAEDVKAPENGEVKQVTEQEGGDIALAAKKMMISVLNGGAVKGSAGTITTFLKSEGYTSVTAGNTLKDYMGVTVYYASGLEKEADVIKMSVIKKYPQVKILPVDTANKETSVSQVTIILGK
jgi:hypothetical protein